MIVSQPTIPQSFSPQAEHSPPSNLASTFEQVRQLEHEVSLLREMITLLLSFEKECIDKLDLKGAKETRNRIVLLTEKQEEMKEKIIKQTQDRHVMQMSQEQEDLINCFDKCWSDYLNELVAQLASVQQKLKEQQKNKREEINQKFASEKTNGFKPTTKLSNLKRKVLGLMKLHNYEQAQFQSQKANKLEHQQRKAWQQRVQQRRKNALELFNRKASKDFEVLRSKNEDLLFRKMNERDNKFQILLKKHQVKRREVDRSSKGMMKSISSASLTKRFQ